MLNSFAEYVQEHCKNVSLDQALAYAKQGDEFLQDFAMGGVAQKKTNMRPMAVCILWSLLKNSYDNNLPFGKGMFNIAFSDDQLTKEFYSLLKSSPFSYGRMSTHYNDRTGGYHVGIDNPNHLHNDPGYVPGPWKFKTVCFGLCTEADGSHSVYFKPETHGADYRNDPVGFLKHGIELLISKVRPQKVKGTKNYRENETVRAEMRGDIIQCGNEIRFNAGTGGLRLKELNTDTTKAMTKTKNSTTKTNTKILPKTRYNHMFESHNKKAQAHPLKSLPNITESRINAAAPNKILPINALHTFKKELNRQIGARDQYQFIESEKNKLAIKNKKTGKSSAIIQKQFDSFDMVFHEKELLEASLKSLPKDLDIFTVVCEDLNEAKQIQLQISTRFGKNVIIDFSQNTDPKIQALSYPSSKNNQNLKL